MTPGVTSISYTSVDNLQKTYKENLGDISLSLSDASTQHANAEKIDAFVRKVNALTKNTYQNCEATTVYDINEILAEE